MKKSRPRLALQIHTLRTLSAAELRAPRGGQSDPGAPSGDPGRPKGDPDHEKLGAFYLGTMFDPASKTAMIEEALIDGVPVIAIDPKGDLGNLVLTFPAVAALHRTPVPEPVAIELKARKADTAITRLALLWLPIDGMG